MAAVSAPSVVAGFATIQRALAEQRWGGVDDLTAVTFGRDQPLRRLTADFVGGLSHVIGSVGDAAPERLANQALELVAMAIGEQAPVPAHPSSTHRAGLLRRLKAEINARLADPDLSISAVAAALGISARYVNLLLESEHESFGRHVLVRRLEKCRRELGDPRLARRQIAEIAFASGFNELSHFSRAFKAKFGMTPRDFRASALEVDRNRRSD